MQTPCSLHESLLNAIPYPSHFLRSLPSGEWRKHQNRLPDTNICIREVITREDYILVRLSGENSSFLVTFTPLNRHTKSESKMAASDGVYSNLPSPSRRFSASLTCLPRLSWDYALSVRYIKCPPIPC